MNLLVSHHEPEGKTLNFLPSFSTSTCIFSSTHGESQLSVAFQPLSNPWQYGRNGASHRPSFKVLLNLRALPLTHTHTFRFEFCAPQVVNRCGMQVYVGPKPGFGFYSLDASNPFSAAGPISSYTSSKCKANSGCCC